MYICIYREIVFLSIQVSTRERPANDRMPRTEASFRRPPPMTPCPPPNPSRRPGRRTATPRSRCPRPPRPGSWELLRVRRKLLRVRPRPSPQPSQRPRRRLRLSRRPRPRPRMRRPPPLPQASAAAAVPGGRAVNSHPGHVGVWFGYVCFRGASEPQTVRFNTRKGAKELINSPKNRGQ